VAVSARISRSEWGLATPPGLDSLGLLSRNVLIEVLAVLRNAGDDGGS
jgi:hypothetical protein